MTFTLLLHTNICSNSYFVCRYKKAAQSVDELISDEAGVRISKLQRLERAGAKLWYGIDMNEFCFIFPSWYAYHEFPRLKYGKEIIYFDLFGRFLPVDSMVVVLICYPHSHWIFSNDGEMHA